MRWILSKGERESLQRERDLVQESEVYLSGHYAEYLDSRNEDVPDWAWLNILTQGSTEHLRSLVTECALYGGARTRTTDWWQAVVFLAGEILRHQHNDRALDELRRTVLVPLELKWLATTGRQPRRPSQLVRTVLDALDGYSSSRRP
jgi:hypothetical protein